MSFWSDSSPIVKGAIVLGVVGIIVAILAYAKVGPFATDIDNETTSQQRGI